MTKNIYATGILICMLVLQTGCTSSLLTYKQSPCDDPLDYYNKLSTQTDEKLSAAEPQASAIKDDTDTCLKLREAIWLSMPGSKQQNDIKALALLKDLKHSQVLSNKNQQFNNMLLQHVSQRQELRNMIGSQDELLKKTEIQIDQLQHIEVEIDKKERSVTSPIDE